MDTQDIYLEPSQDGSSYALSSTYVQIHTCRNYETSLDSSKVKSTKLVDYGWEVKAYKGKLVAVHRDGNFLAYILHATTRSVGAVRIFHRHTKYRALVKNFEGEAVDLAWAFTIKPLYLGIVDEGGNLFVHNISVENDEIKTTLFFHMKRTVRQPNVNYRIMFCPYVSDDAVTSSTTSCPSDVNSTASSLSRKNCNNNDKKIPNIVTAADLCGYADGLNENSNSSASSAVPSSLRSFGLLSISYGCKVDVIDLESLIENHGREVEIENCEYGVARFESRGEILAMALSPDATALAVANSVGEIVFCLMESFSEFRQAHLWVPHGGRPVSAIYFLDDVTVMNKESHFWKYALTAADNNKELKLFNCENWACISTLKLCDDEDYEDDNSFSKAPPKPLVLAMDWTASYLFLSDIDRKSLYIVHINQMETTARFISFSEFPLVQPALSVAVVEASKKKFRPFSPGSYHDLDRVSDNDNEEDGQVVGIRTLLYAVNPKSLLQLEIRYQPSVLEGGDSHFDSTASFKLDPFRDHLSDLSTESNVAVSSAPAADELSKLLSIHSKSLPDASSPPTGSTTPVDSPNMPEGSRGIVSPIPRLTSSSPNSQEVRDILSNNVASSMDDNKLSFEDEDADGTKYDQDDNVVEVEYSTALESAIRPNSSTNDKRENSDSENVRLTNVVLVDAVSKLRDQVDRVMDHMQKQESELMLLKTALVNQTEILQKVAILHYSLEQQMVLNSDVLQNCQSAYQSFRSDSFQQNLHQILQESVQKNFELCFKQHVTGAISEGFNNLTFSIRRTFDTDLANLLATVETNLRDSFCKTIKSKPVIDLLGQSCGHAVAEHAQATYKHTFQSIIAPSFETASKALFTQINEIFRGGTAEYLDQLQKQVNASRSNAEEIRTSLNTHFNTLSEQLKTNVDKQLNRLSQVVQSHVERSVQQNLTKQFDDRLASVVKSVVKDELKKALNENQNQLNDVVMKALRSQTATPSPAAAPQNDRTALLKDITAAINQNNYAVAFQQALNALDLSLVTYVCNKISPTELFSIVPCPLSQAVILSLIQQLSNELDSQTDLKLKYLTEAVTSIDVRNIQAPNHQQNVNRVIVQLERNLESFAATPAAAPFSRLIKILTMAAQSLTK